MKELNCIGFVVTILSHIIAGLYMQKRKYSKLITACLWAAYAGLTACVILFGRSNIVVGFFAFFVLHFIFFLASSVGRVGENTFLFLTYANSFCIFIGVNCILTAYFGDGAAVQICSMGILTLIHVFLYKVLIPTYQKSKVFISSGWWKLNIVLILFVIQFLNQYAFEIVDLQSANALSFDFFVFSIIFYATLAILFDFVKDVAEKNKKTIENKELKNVAYTDALTGLKNRTAYIKFAKKQVQKHKNNTDANLLLAMMDVDDFKSVNDTKGHVVGDAVLKQVGAVIAQTFEDFRCECFRIGGDEFVLVLEDTPISEVEEQMKHMNVELLTSVGVTFSYGFCAVDFERSKPFELALKAADREMYSDKQEKKVHS